MHLSWLRHTMQLNIMKNRRNSEEEDKNRFVNVRKFSFTN